MFIHPEPSKKPNSWRSSNEKKRAAVPDGNHLPPKASPAPLIGLHLAGCFPEMAFRGEVSDISDIEMILLDRPDGTFHAVTRKRVLKMLRVA